MSQEFFKKCNSCKKEIAFASPYYVCSVSSCNGLRTGYVFCSISCFERHIPGARHRDAAAIEKQAPKNGQSPMRRIIAGPSSGSAVSLSREVLIVASKLKAYIKERSDMNTSASVMDVLSDRVRRLCDDAIDQARAEGRKTVLDRDFK